MARALIVGCGCRGREAGRLLLDAGLRVRGTSRTQAGVERIEAAGLEGSIADPDRVGTVVELLDDVSVVVWAMASVTGPGAAEDLNGPRLERILERVVDTPVRGFVYEGRGTVDEAITREGARLVAEAEARWRIPTRVVETPPDPPGVWARAIADAAESFLSFSPQLGSA